MNKTREHHAIASSYDSSIKTFESLREDILSKVADAFDEVTYADGECIVRQGAKGDTFYIVAKGN
jgi:cGMP-dependent protein kinase 1